MFTLKESDLWQLWLLNQFEVPKDRWVFFGLRGCLPLDIDNHDFAKEHLVRVVETDHLHPRCILGQWQPGKGIALFSGSTVPHRKHIKTALDKGGKGANQLMTGCFNDYRKGRHKSSSKTGHQAFRQDNKLPIRRSADDLDFDLDDRVEYGQPFDNLHAAWSMGIEHDNFASAGCQVVVGFPKCVARNNKPDTGAWKVFKENAYAIEQDSFVYVLLQGRDAQKMTLSGAKLSPRLRFGSQGKLVEAVQQSLKTNDHYEGKIDGDFGPRTLRAVLDFQTAEFGPSADDGIIGPNSAAALDMPWPNDFRTIPATTPRRGAASVPRTGRFRFVDKHAVAPDGTRFAKKFKKGVFNFGNTSIGDFVRAHRADFPGVSPSLLNIMEAVSANEGKLEAINTWDNAFLTFGVFQWTAGAGTGGGELAALVARLKQEHGAVFEQYFGQHGLDLFRLRPGPPEQPGIVPTGFFSLNNEVLNTTAKKEKLRTLEWAYRFWLAGHDDLMRQVQIKQAMDRIQIFYKSPRHRINGRDIADYVSSECSVALLLDQHVNRPGHVPKTLAKAITQVNLRKDPKRWSDEDEKRILETYIELRSRTSMTDSDKRAQVVFDAVARGVISDKRGSLIL